MHWRLDFLLARVGNEIAAHGQCDRPDAIRRRADDGRGSKLVLVLSPDAVVQSALMSLDRPDALTQPHVGAILRRCIGRGAQAAGIGCVVEPAKNRARGADAVNASITEVADEEFIVLAVVVE